MTMVSKSKKYGGNNFAISVTGAARKIAKMSCARGDMVEELRQKVKAYYLYGNLLPTPKYLNTIILAKKAMT